MASLHKGDRVILTGRLRLREWDTGAKKGIAVEIDADSIGHDLLFGTSRFEKDAAPAQRSLRRVELELDRHELLGELGGSGSGDSRTARSSARSWQGRSRVAFEDAATPF